MKGTIPAFLKAVPSGLRHNAPQPFSNLRYAQEFSALVRSLSRNPNNPRLLAALDSTLAKAPLLDSTTSVLVLRGLSRSKKLTRAKDVLSGLRKRGTIPDPFLYSLVLHCLVPDGRIRDVESVWREIVSGTSHRCMDASDFVVYLCRRSEDTAEIERVYHRISSSRWDLRREGYVALIGAMCEENNPNPGLARNVLREMEEKGFEADELNYFALFQSFCRIGNVLEADSVLRSLVDRWDHELDISVYGNFFYGLCRSGRLREARKLFDKLAKKKDRRLEVSAAPALQRGRRVIFQLSPSAKVTEAMAFEAYFRSLCSAGRVENAETMLKEAARKSVVPGISAYRSFIEALFRAGRVDDAIGLFEAERRKGHLEVGGMAVAVIEGLCKVGRVDEGCQLLREIADEGFVPTTMVWNWVLESLWKGGRVGEAIGLFDRMRAGSAGCSARPDASTYGAMIHGFLRKGDGKTATSLLEAMAGEKLPVNVSLCSAVARSLHAQGKLEESCDFLSKMIENGRLVSYAAWERLFESMIIRDKDDVLKTYEI